MSDKVVEFFFDVGSAASYLAWTQLPALAAEAGARIVWRPMLLGGVFKAAGNVSPASVPAKGRWMFEDLSRFARRYGVPFAQNPHFPVNTLAAMRGATACLLQGEPMLVRYLGAVFPAMWAEGRNLGDAAEMAAVLQDAGIDAQDLAARIADPAVKAALVATTTEAVERGVFGAPTIFAGGQMHFGQDRLDFVRDALR